MMTPPLTSVHSVLRGINVPLSLCAHCLLLRVAIGTVLGHKDVSAISVYLCVSVEETRGVSAHGNEFASGTMLIKGA